MKLKLMILFITIITIIGFGTLGFLDYQAMINHQVSPMLVSFDDQSISSSSVNVEHELFFSMIKLNQETLLEKTNLSVSTISHHLKTPYPTDVKIIYLDKSWTQSSSETLRFEQSGRYTLSFSLVSNNETHTFSVILNVLVEPIIEIDTSDLYQGDVIKVEISNVLKNDVIEVNSHYKPSLMLRSNDQAIFFIPLAYREAAKLYPLTLKINEIEYLYELDVQAYEFKEIHFTVPVSTVNSTVGNQDAVIEYREVIYPTYESAVDVLYIDTPFRIPVENARVSSTFGEMRFVNNASTPTRHAGIDYAIECGTPVYASNAGYVEVSQFLTMIGNTIVIDHGLGLKTYYEHMESLEVEAGELVVKGQVIGYVGTTGYSTGCHLHFQAMIKNQSFNPDSLYTLIENPS
jgi:murein DD-endopeptidase MepM/ murein hydrolase activator NlpD